MLKITSFLRLPNGNFVKVKECKTRPIDPDYVEGAIEISVDGVEVVGKREWDYVDQLWAYIVDMMDSLRSSEVASTYYPDQPIKLEFACRGPQVLITAVVGEKERRGRVDRAELERVVGDAGRLFFQRMAELLPGNAQLYDSLQSRLPG